MSVMIAMMTGATLGAASGFHCAAMCGPLVATVCTRERSVDPGAALSYVTGRTVGYAMIGALAASLGGPLTGTWSGAVRLVAGLLAAVALMRQGWKLLRTPPRAGLVQLQTRRPSRWRASFLGLATAAFPCGALIAAVLAAVALGGARDGALAMATFSIASAPLLLSPSWLGASIGRRLGARALRYAGAALILAAVGIATMSAIVALTPAKPACCRHG